ncbi:MAG: TIGR01244 family sulfur transferase [Paracoccaceae bacterium]
MPDRKICDTYSVGGQIVPGDLATLAARGFTSVICNRPDKEVDDANSSQAMAAEAARRGLRFLYNPISHDGLTAENLRLQAEALEAATGPVFAYCRSGQRSTLCWSFAMAGTVAVDDIIACAAAAGFNLEGLRANLGNL